MPKYQIEKILSQKRILIDKTIEKYLPRVITNRYMDFLVGKNYGYNPKVLQKTISEPVWNFLDRGGKRWRPILFAFLLDALGTSNNKTKDFLIIPELIHTGSLIIDDIEDNSELRRNQKCLHHLFGEDVAINAGNFLYFLPLLIFLKHKKSFSAAVYQMAYQAYVQEMINISLGQAVDIAWHRDLALPRNENEYYEMTRQKTGAMVRLPVKWAAIFSGLSEQKANQLAEIFEKIAVAFQIQDDILDIDLSGKKRIKFGKSFGNDIKEGKKTLMVIYVLKKAKERDKRTLLAILRKHTNNFYDVSKVIEIFQKYKAVEYARQRAIALTEKAKKELEDFLGVGKKTKNLCLLIDFLINRTY